VHENKRIYWSAFFAATLIASPGAVPQATTHHRTEPVKAPAGNAVDASATRLPVTRVLLYKNGVGFFEHSGSVHGNERVAIDFTSAQLNDVLQSLTAIDLNGGHIAGAEYSSTTPLEQQLKTLSLGLGADPSTDEFYRAIRGARVEVRTGTFTVTGRLLDVEYRSVKADDDEKPSLPVMEKRYITVVSDAGAAQTIELNSKTQVQLLDSELHQDVTRYLQLLASTHAQGLRHLTLEADGSGTRQIRLSYIGEVPVWKATYRILFGDEAKPDGAADSATMQGWAVVDNTTGSDWNNVQLSLVAGAPQSFIQPISQPYYSRRPEIGLPEEAQLTPQTHESGDEESAPQPAAGGVVGGMLGGVGQGTGGGAYHVSAGDRMVAQSSAAVSVNAAPMLSYEDSAARSIAPDTKGSAFDDYFEYALSSPVTIRKNESALVPILQAKMDVQRVTLWSPSQPTALRALWLKNTSNLTLDRGSFSIVEDGKFGGEGLLDPIHPSEKRLLSYAADQAVRVTVDYEHDTRKTQQIAVSKGVLTEKTLEIAEVEYLVHNAATEPRDVIVEQPMRQGWKLDSDPLPVETTSDAYRFNVMTKAGETVRLHIGERHTISQRYKLLEMNDQQIDYIVRSTGDEAELRQQLAPILDAKRKVADLDAQIAAATKSIEDITKDQQRLRENLTALKGSAEERALVRRYTDELNTQEDKINGLQKQQESLQEQRTTAEKDLSDKVQSLQVDQTLS
jgi:hypothetical protein